MLFGCIFRPLPAIGGLMDFSNANMHQQCLPWLQIHEPSNSPPPLASICTCFSGSLTSCLVKGTVGDLILFFHAHLPPLCANYYLLTQGQCLQRLQPQAPVLPWMLFYCVSWMGVLELISLSFAQ